MNPILKRIAPLCGKIGSSRFASSIDLRGVYPPITTPFDTQENIDYGKLKYNLEKWSSLQFRGYVVQGSTGEFAYLSDSERVEVIKKTRQYIPDSKLLVAGSGCESTRATIEMTARMAGSGADACLVVTPSYYKGAMSEKALYQHYIKVADSSPVPIILYSVPPNTNLDLPADVIVKLSEHANIIGVKDSGGNISKIGSVVHRTRSNGFQVLAGSGGFFLPAITIGCVGGVFALANVLGSALCQLQDLAQQNKLEEAKALQHRLIAPNAAVTAKYGIAGVKQAMEWFGLYGGPTRSPIQPLAPEIVKKLRNDFVENGFLNAD